MTLDMFETMPAPAPVVTRNGRRFEARPLTEAEALAHPWWGVECPACHAPAGVPCKGARKPKPLDVDSACRHRPEDGAPYCCIQGMRTQTVDLDYQDPRYLDPPPPRRVRGSAHP
jgi:hypothetical protein